MGCAVDCMLKRPFYYHLYYTPKGVSSVFTESLSVLGLGRVFFSEDFNFLSLVINRPISTPSLYAEIYTEKKRWFYEALKSQNEVLPHFLGESDIWSYCYVLVTYGVCQHSFEWWKLVLGDGIWGQHSLKIILFFSLRLLKKRKVKDIFRIWRSSWVLQNHTDKMRLDKIKPAVFTVICFLSHPEILGVTKTYIW